MINNFESAKELFYFGEYSISPKLFFQVNIIKRYDFGPESFDRLIKTYLITSVQTLSFMEPEIIGICNGMEATAYISPAAKKLQDFYGDMIVSMVDYIKRNTTDSVHSAINSVCCGLQPESKRYIIHTAGLSVRRKQELMDYLKDTQRHRCYIMEVAGEEGDDLVITPIHIGDFKSNFPDVKITSNNFVLYKH